MAKIGAERGMNLPPGTAVYCGPKGLVLKLSWRSRRGTHIVRTELPLKLCDPAKRPELRAAARTFRHLVAAERAASR